MGGRFTLWPSGDSHLPSCLSRRAATSCNPAARLPVAHERLGPWRERPPSPKARYGFGARWKFTPRPCPPGVAPAPTIPGGKAVRTPLRDAADQPGPPPAAAVAQTARAALLPESARVFAGSRPPPRRPWPRHRDPRLPLRNGPRPGFTARPRGSPVRGGRPTCRESGCPHRACPLAFLQRTAGPVATRRGGWDGMHIPTSADATTGIEKGGSLTGTASVSGAAQPSRRPWCNRKPNNDLRSRIPARSNGDSAHMRVLFTCAASSGHRRIPFRVSDRPPAPIPSTALKTALQS